MDKHLIDPQVYDLYDEYCHSNMERREFLRRAAALVVVGGSALAMAEAMLPRYARAQTISFTDKRIKARYVTYDSPGGNSGKMRGYLVQPKRRGSVSRGSGRPREPGAESAHRGCRAGRAAVAGFLALAPDGLSPIGGYPGNDDDGKKMQRSLDRGKLRTDLLNSARYLKGHESSNGKLGATGFCFGGGVVNYLAVQMGGDLNAGVPFYGSAPKSADDVARIKAPLLIQYAENDPRINKQAPAYHAALKAQRCRLRGVHLSGHPPRLPQQLDAALRRSRRQARVGTDGRLLQEAPVIVEHPPIPRGKPAASRPPVSFCELDDGRREIPTITVDVVAVAVAQVANNGDKGR